MPDAQLSLDLKLPPALQRLADDGKHVSLAGHLKIGGEFAVRDNLDLGDDLVVKIETPGGRLIAYGQVGIGGVSLIPIEDKDLGVIGVDRVHKGKVTASTLVELPDPREGER